MRVVPRGIVTIGYEGRELDDFVSTLRAHDVDVLVDVRLNAMSRRRGFSKRALAAAVLAADIDYVHEPLLGNPVDNREGYRAGHKRARDRYRARLTNGSSDAVDRLVDLAMKNRVAVLCVELDHTTCHREELVKVAGERAPKLKVEHLA
jgi:uncharacterized protein (DUF488 family)